MRTYRFSFGTNRVIKVVAATFTDAKALFRAQLSAEGLL